MPNYDVPRLAGLRKPFVETAPEMLAVELTNALAKAINGDRPQDPVRVVYKNHLTDPKHEISLLPPRRTLVDKSAESNLPFGLIIVPEVRGQEILVMLDDEALRQTWEKEVAPRLPRALWSWRFVSREELPGHDQARASPSDVVVRDQEMKSTHPCGNTYFVIVAATLLIIAIALLLLPTG